MSTLAKVDWAHYLLLTDFESQLPVFIKPQARSEPSLLANIPDSPEWAKKKGMFDDLPGVSPIVTIIELVSLMLIPPLALLAFGLVTGWIVSGFRAPAQK